MVDTCVGVTGLDVADYPMPGLGIAKCLKLYKGIKVVGLTYSALSSGCYSRDVFDEICLLGKPLQNKQKLYEDILRLKEKNDLQVVIPSIRWEVPAYARLKGKFKRNNIHVFLPKDEDIVDLFDKRVAKFVSGTHIKIPFHSLLRDRRGFAEKLSRHRFPVIIRNAIEDITANNAAEAKALISPFFAYGYNSPPRVLDYVKGEEYSVAALADEQHKLSGIVVAKILVQADHGSPWIVVSVCDDELVTFTKKLITHLNWAGPMELRFIRQQSQGTCFLIKIQPCFPSWIYLGANIRQNLPLKLVELALGKTIKYNTQYDTGVMLVRNAKDITSDVHTLGVLATSGRLSYHESD